MADEKNMPTFSATEHQRRKALSRQRDEERLERGEVSARELQQENCGFSGIDFEWFTIRRKDGSFRRIPFDPPSPQHRTDRSDT